MRFFPTELEDSTIQPSRILIERPVDEVAAYSADPESAPEWYTNIKAVEWKTPPPLRVGSRLAFVAQFLGRRVAYTYEVVELAAAVIIALLLVDARRHPYRRDIRTRSAASPWRYGPSSGTSAET